MCFGEARGRWAKGMELGFGRSGFKVGWEIIARVPRESLHFSWVVNGRWKGITGRVIQLSDET
jgi:hypothetical protein